MAAQPQHNDHLADRHLPVCGILRNSARGHRDFHREKYILSGDHRHKWTSTRIPMLFVAMVNSIMTLLSTIPVITVALFLKKEEDSGRVDTVFSRPVARTAAL
jgi:hypothetical protein